MSRFPEPRQWAVVTALLGACLGCGGPPRRSRDDAVLDRPLRSGADRALLRNRAETHELDLAQLDQTAHVRVPDATASNGATSLGALALGLFQQGGRTQLAAWAPAQGDPLAADLRATWTDPLPLGSDQASVALATTQIHVIAAVREPAGPLQIIRLDPHQPQAARLTVADSSAGSSGGTLGSSCDAQRCIQLLHQAGQVALSCIAVRAEPDLQESGRVEHRLDGVAPEILALATSLRGDEVAVAVLRREPGAETGDIDLWLLGMDCQRRARLTVGRVTVADGQATWDRRQVEVAHLGVRIHVLWADEDLMQRRILRTSSGVSATAPAEPVDLGEGDKRLTTLGALPLPERGAWLIAAAGVAALDIHTFTTAALLDEDGEGRLHLRVSRQWQDLAKVIE